MPITQDRLASLIVAGEDYRQSCEMLIKQIKQTYTHALAIEVMPIVPVPLEPAKQFMKESDKIKTIIELISQIDVIADFNILLNDPIPTTVNLIRERDKYKANMRSNIKAANLMRERRQASGIPSINTAPLASLPYTGRESAQIYDRTIKAKQMLAKHDAQGDDLVDTAIGVKMSKRIVEEIAQAVAKVPRPEPEPAPVLEKTEAELRAEADFLAPSVPGEDSGMDGPEPEFAPEQEIS